MRQWVLGSNGRSMMLWEDDVQLATVEQNIGTDSETGEFFLLDEFSITFFRKYNIWEGGVCNETRKALSHRNYYYATLNMAVDFAERYAKDGVPESVKLDSTEIFEFIAGQFNRETK